VGAVDNYMHQNGALHQAGISHTLACLLMRSIRIQRVRLNGNEKHSHLGTAHTHTAIIVIWRAT